MEPGSPGRLARSTTLPATIPLLDQRGIRRAKEILRSRSLEDVRATIGVRSVIDRSWRRCVGGSVRAVPHRATESPNATASSLLLESAEPVLNRIAEHLQDSNVVLFLSDARGNILSRKVKTGRLRNKLDNACSAEGFNQAENNVGTNALGTAIMERRALTVDGDEHFSDLLSPFTCAGTPIFDPISRRLIGAFALTVTLGDDSSLLHTFTVDIGRQIELSLASVLQAHDQALMQSYLYANRNRREQILVINERTMFANTAGLSNLVSESHATLWQHLSEHTPAGARHTMTLPLHATYWSDAEVEKVDTSSDYGPTYMIRIIPSDDRHSTVTHHRQLSDTGATPQHGSLHPVPAICKMLTEVAAHNECLAVDGGPGTGKLRTARNFLRHLVPDAEPHVIDISALSAGELLQAVTAAPAVLDTGRPIVLQHAQDLAACHVNRVKALVRYAHDRSVPVVFTVDSADAPEHVVALIAQIATTVSLPHLSDMPDSILALVHSILDELDAPHSGTRFSSEAQQIMLRWRWPGNLTELRRTVTQIAQRMPGRVVQPADLPSRVQEARSQRHLTMYEEAERAAIVKALQQHSGNRVKAAETLGIGRSTLYRKLRAHQINA